MKGVVQKDGSIKGENGELYEPDMRVNDTILLAATSWARKPIKEYEGKNVEFVLSPTGHAYNFTIIK
jgi:hypothetical protein